MQLDNKRYCNTHAAVDAAHISNVARVQAAQVQAVAVAVAQYEAVLLKGGGLGSGGRCVIQIFIEPSKSNQCKNTVVSS